MVDPEEIASVYASKTENNIVALDVDGRNLWVCPVTLSSQSHFFARMFNSDFVEKNQGAVKMEGKTMQDFAPFVKALMDPCSICLDLSKGDVPFAQCLALLRLADEYQADSLRNFLVHHFQAKIIPGLDLNDPGYQQELIDVASVAHAINAKLLAGLAAEKLARGMPTNFLLSLRGKLDTQLMENVLAIKLGQCQVDLDKTRSELRVATTKINGLELENLKKCIKIVPSAAQAQPKLKPKPYDRNSFRSNGFARSAK